MSNKPECGAIVHHNGSVDRNFGPCTREVEHRGPCAHPAVATKPRLTQSPSSQGWWCRKRGGRSRWFWVEELDEGPSIYVDDIEDFLPVNKFTGPLTTWYGPVMPDWDEDGVE